MKIDNESALRMVETSEEMKQISSIESDSSMECEKKTI